MSNIRTFRSRDESIAEEAGEWIARLGGDFGADDERGLAAWVSQSDEHYRVLMEMASLWDSMDVLGRLAEVVPEPPVRRTSAARRSTWAAAAALVAGVATALLIGLNRPDGVDAPTVPGTDEAVVYETALGEQATFTLPDGTELVLNTNSRVDVTFTVNNRLLVMVRGELHVSVAHDPQRPLSVVVGHRVLQAVGTEFNLEITSDQRIELIVSEGLVMVGVLDLPTGDVSAEEPLLLMPDSTLVAAGQEATIDSNDEDVAEVETAPIQERELAIKLSWREGNLIFRGESLEEAMNEVGRYTAIKFVFLDDKARKVTVAGLFKAGDVDGLLSALRNHFNIAYEWRGDDTILLSAE